jgi:hypothetical protein
MKDVLTMLGQWQLDVSAVAGTHVSCTDATRA